MKLTDEDSKAIEQWNGLSEEVTTNAMAHFLPSWFANMRSLIREGFPIQSLELLASKLSHFNTFTVLGSGPGAYDVALRLPHTVPQEALFCGPTLLGTLMLTGRRPTALICADSSPLQYQFLKELDPPDAAEWDVVLPVSADPSWYAPDSILSRDRMYFYLPYLNYFGDFDLGYNHVLKALFPEVRRWIAQAGSVANTALNFADMCCAQDASKRIYLGVDCSWWPKESPPMMRAPHAKKLPDGTYVEAQTEWWKSAQKQRAEVISVEYAGKTIESDLVSIGYAIQMFYLIHDLHKRKPEFLYRYALFPQCSYLYFGASPDVTIPLLHPEESDTIVNRGGTDNWPYASLLGLIKLSNTLQSSAIEEAKRLRQEGERPQVGKPDA